MTGNVVTYIKEKKMGIFDLTNIFGLALKDYKIDVMPYLLSVTKGAYDSYIKENFEMIVSYCSKTGIAIGNLGWIAEFVKSGVQVYGDYGLNLYNSEAVAWNREMKM